MAAVAVIVVEEEVVVVALVVIVKKASGTKDDDDASNTDIKCLQCIWSLARTVDWVGPDDVLGPHRRYETCLLPDDVVLV